MKKGIQRVLLVCDLDNTLYDWYGYFVPSFYAMLESAVDLLKCDRETLLDEFREVHQRYHDSEHPYALLETRTVKAQYPGLSPRELVRLLNPALHVFNASRQSTLRVYPGVTEALSDIKASGTRLVAHTESRFYAAVDRLSRLGLIDFFDRVYCREREQGKHPVRPPGEWLPDFPFGKIVELPKSELKPNPRILEDIAHQQDARLSHVAYIGDSIARDVLMAKAAGAFAIWAAYGAHPAPSLYEQLVRVSHWTAEDVEREKSFRIAAENVRPDFVCALGFGQTLDALSRFRDNLRRVA